MKARFYISSERVQDVGYRAFIASKILESNLEGLARNLPDGRVEVLLEGEEKEINRFLELIKEKEPDLAKKPIISDLEFDESLKVPKIMKTSQALILEQFGKGIISLDKMSGEISGMRGEISGMSGEISGMRGEMRIGFKEMREEMKAGFDNLGNKIDGLGSKIDEVGNRIEELPEKIADALKKF